ncbi:MAG TPA: potassium transporter KefA [Lachnospiraceae bacterium]|nr:potassium transporter KefA [Lachnospiraceae bacterium]
MNKRIVFYTIGFILLIEAVLMMLPLVVSVIYREAAGRNAFLISALISAAAGGLMIMKKPKKTRIFAREGFAIVALAWIMLSVFGCLPFVISGEIPNFIDAFFETVSGFTTTGSSILTDVEAMSHSLVFWRSFTHWVGGMGVLVFVMIIVPLGGESNMHLLRAETPGPTAGKLVPRMRDTAKILYGIYLVMTVVEVVLLCCGGMSLFDSLINSFGSAGTGGFSNWGDSIGHYNSEFFEVVIGVFMLLFGVNFSLYYLLLLKRVKAVFKSEELRWYLGIIAFATITIAVNIEHIYGSFHQALRYSFFQVSSIITTTGYSSADFNQWPQYAKTILVMLMICGACAGSTGGGLKVSRVLILFRTARRGLKRLIHSHSVEAVWFEHKGLEEGTISNCGVYLIVYCMIAISSLVVISIDNFSYETNVTAMLSCLNNIGPGLGTVGPMGNFAGYSWLSKLVLSFDMLAGRLELYPILLLFAPSIWRQGPYSRRGRKRTARRRIKKAGRVMHEEA